MNKITEKNKLEWEGKVLENTKGESFKIIKYVGTFEVHIEFLKTKFSRISSLSNIKKGNVSDLMSPSVYGVGYLGGDKYKTKNNSVSITYYKIWQSILQRCYDKNCSSYKNYGEKRVTISEEWKNYQNFAEWWENNRKEYMEDWVIDKDILFKHNKVYSSETCCFVPDEINNLFTKRDSERGDYPIGVRLKTDTRNGKTYNYIIAQINKGGKKVHLGCFETPEDAFNSYKIAKENYIKELCEEYKNLLANNVYEALLNYSVEITD